VISELPEPSVFIKHVCFTNFTKFNLPKPIYLNVVRDPVERVISWFYYVRAPWYFVERKAAFPDLPLPHPGKRNHIIKSINFLYFIFNNFF